MDFYKDLGQAIQNNISDNWDTVIVKIESSLNKMCVHFRQNILYHRLKKKN